VPQMPGIFGNSGIALKRKFRHIWAGLILRHDRRAGGPAAHGAPHLHDAQRAHQHGMAVQVDPMRPNLKPRGTKRLKLKCDILLSTSAFKFNLRHYSMAGVTSSTVARLAKAMHEVTK